MKIIRINIKQKKVSSASRRKELLGWLILAAGAALFLLFSALLCRPLARLAADPQQMRRFVLTQGAFGRTAFLGVEILQGFLPIPLELTAVAGGYIFGKAHGCVLSACSVAVSTGIIFKVTRMFGHRLADLFVAPSLQRRVRWFRSKKVRDTVTFLVFLVPGMPKRLFVFTAGLVPQDFWRFLVISTAARVPSLLVCSFGGSALFSGDYRLAAALLVLVGVLAAAGFAFYRRTVPPQRRL